MLLIISLLLPGVTRSAQRERELVLEAESKRVDLIERLIPSVVTVFDAKRRGGASGVLIDSEGYGLTNYHVVAGMLNTREGAAGSADGKVHAIEVLGIDPTGDVAMFRLRGVDEASYATLGDSDTVRVGDAAIVMGDPFSLSEDYSPSVSLGIVTGVHRYQWGVKGNLVYSDCIQVDAAVNPGNSGGPLFNERGEIVGITGRISLKPREPLNPRGRFNVGVGYAITSNQIKRFLPALRAGLLGRHGTLQATVDHRPGAGIVFTRMLRRGAADRAEIRLGDRIVSFDDVVITSPNHFASMLGTYPADWEVPITVERDGRRLDVVARLDPIEPRMSTAFTEDREANLRQVRRVLNAHRNAVLTRAASGPPRRSSWTVNREYHATPGRRHQAEKVYHAVRERGRPIRMESSGHDRVVPRGTDVNAESESSGPNVPARGTQAALDAALISSALDILYERLLAQIDELDLGAVRYAGGNRAAHGTSLVEVIRWRIDGGSVADFWFDTSTREVIRIELRDSELQVMLTIGLSNPSDVGGVRRACTIDVRGAGYHYRDTLTDWEVEW
ncbi:MAG: S1C family serine protease, partial [Phycisphaerae bacterium]